MISAFYKHYSLNGTIKKFKVGGLAWPVFFFGMIALIIRGQYKLALISLIPFSRWIIFIIANRTRHIALTNKGWKLVK